MEANYPVIPITDETTPLSIIPAPYPQNGEKLLSGNWDANNFSNVSDVFWNEKYCQRQIRL